MRFRSALMFAALLAAIAALGCQRTLPRIRSEYLDQRMIAIPQGAAPVLSWHAEKKGIFTAWHVQDVAVSVRAYVPQNASDASSIIWDVKARNGEGKTLPFIGVQKKYVNDSGVELAVIVPPLELAEMPTGLYVFIVPNATFTLGKLTSIAPVVVVTEIRAHLFKPFQHPIPLIPDQTSPLTPAPPPEKKPPEGTPIPS